MDLLWVGLGGALGAVARYVVGIWVLSRVGAAFPFPTLVVNLTGGFAIGVLVVLLTEWVSLDPAWRLLLIVGFLGGYTTFSSYTLEVFLLAERGEWVQATWYVVGSNGLGLAATALGVLLTRAAIR